MQKRISYCLFIIYLLLSVLILCSCNSKPSTNSAAAQDTSKLCEATSCKSKAREGYNYCEAHICQIEGCQNATVVRWGKYCQDHMCSREGCSNPRAEGSNLCTAHSDSNQLCEAEGCTHLKITEEKYCSLHKVGYTCSYWNCKNESKEGSYFCVEHQSMQCKYENCHNPVGSLSDYKNTNYCSYHGCHYPDCNEKNNGNFFPCYCDYHEKVYWENPSAVSGNNGSNNQNSALKDTLIVDDTDAGKQLWKVYAKSSEFHFKASCSGPGYFGIKLLDSNQDFCALVMNEVGSYELDKSVYGLIEGEIYYIQVEFSRGTISYSWSGTYGR